MFGGGVSFGGSGSSGNTIVYGSGAPTSLVGNNGDSYIDTTAHVIYGPKSGGSWGAGTSLVGPSGSDGSAGAAGNTVLYGSGAPSGATGIDGNFYIDTTAHALYGPKAAGAWSSSVALVGPQGTTGPQGDPNLSQMEIFGTGGDGDLTQATGILTLQRDMYYRNVTLTGTASVNTNGYRMHVSGTLDISNAGASAIHCNATAPSQTTAATTAGVSSGIAGQIGTLGGGAAANLSAAGSTAAGVQASLPTVNAGASGGPGGAGGAGGASGTGSAGGAARGTVTGLTPRICRRLDLNTQISIWATGGTSSAAGSSGGGDGTNSSNAGAASCGGGGQVQLCAKIINRGASTAVGCISANGANGGAFSSVKNTGNIGGFGGGGGSGGGWIYIVYGTLTGAQAANAIAVDGGSGSTGGAGFGSGVGGQGGQGGSCGRVTICDLGAITVTEAVSPSGVAATATVPAGAASAGSAGTAGVQGRTNL